MEDYLYNVYNTINHLISNATFATKCSKYGKFVAQVANARSQKTTNIICVVVILQQHAYKPAYLLWLGSRQQH